MSACERLCRDCDGCDCDCEDPCGMDCHEITERNRAEAGEHPERPLEHEG